MKKQIILLAFSMLVLSTLACSADLPQTQNNNIPQTEDQVPRITVEDAKAALDSRQAILVDVRSAQSYEASRIAGAISIPMDDIENNINRLALEKNQWIITYCT